MATTPIEKLVTISGLDRYTGHVEEKNVQVTRNEYTDLPSTKLTDGKSYYIKDEGVIIKNGVEYGGSSAGDTTYTLSVGTGADADKIVLTPSSGTPDVITVPFATNAGSASNASSVSGHTVATDVPANAVFTDTTYENATTAVAGLMSTTDKGKVDALGTASTKDVPTTGNASTAQVVMGNDTRLSDARPASDVSSWAKASTKPSYTASEVGLGNVTNNKQIKGLASGTTENHVVTFGTDGYTVKDSGFTIGKSVPSDAKFTDTTYSNATTAVAGLMSTDDKSKLNGIASGAEVNQNAFSNIVANGTTVSADSKTDTLTIEAGSNVTITGDATNDKITISATDTTYSDATTATHGLMSTTDKSKLDGIAAGAEVNVQANWTETNSSADAYIKNKPTLGTAAAKDIPATGNASTSQVVMGNDTRLSDARNAADVYSWAKASTKPTYSYSEITNTPTIPTITDTYSGTSSDGMSGKAVKSAIDALDGTITGTAGAGKTLTALSQTNGKVSATFGNISITKSQVSDFPSLGTAAAKNYTTSVTNGSSDLVTSGAVWTAIDNLPEPMVFKGSLGTGGTITALPVDGSAAIGDTYKVITAGTYASKTAKVGDTFICLTKTSSANTWELIPSGDEPSGTVTSVGVSNGGGLSVSGSPVTTSGTITISHADTSSQASVNNSGRTYIQDITLDTYGHVTGIASATETVTNTDRYVNAASFAHDSTNNNIKMTLTRAGSDTATVTGNIPKVSSSSAGVAPKGAAVSSQTQTTKFLREDGTWAAPSYTTNTNTTYTFAAGTNSFKVTPSGGTAQTVNVTPSVSKSDVGLGSVANIDQSKAITSITRSGKTFTATALDGTTSTFNQQDNNTTYSNATTAAAGLMSKDDKVKLNGIATGATANTGTVTSVGLTAGDGISVSGGPVTTSGSITVTNKGVRSIATGTSNGTINVNTNGSTANVAVKGLGTAAYTASTAYAASGHNHDSTYLKLAGGTMTGRIKLASNGFVTNNENYGYSVDQYGNFTAGSSATNFMLYDKNKTAIFDLEWNTGNVTTEGKVKIGGSNGCSLQYNTTTKSLDFVFI